MLDAEDVKPDLSASPVKPKVDKIKVQIMHEGRAIAFAVKPSSKLEKAFVAAAKMLNMDRKSLRFNFNGETLLGEETPESLEMEEDDQIDAHLQQLGGGV